MKKNVIVFGLISGFIVSTFMAISMLSCHNSPDLDGSMVMGFTAMIVAFSFVFVGIKNFRDKYNDGVISFGKAFKIGILITLIASTMYVATWAIEYHYFIPDFMDKYTTVVIKKAQDSGATQAELEIKSAEMLKVKEDYKNPVFFVLYTYAEIFPVGLLITLISAGILKRKSKVPDEVVPG